MVLLCYAGLRWLFYGLNQSAFPGLGWGEGLRLALIGIRFDLVPLLYFNSLYILLALLPWRSRTKVPYQKMLKVLFLCSNGLALGLELLSIPYFRFSARRLIRSDFGLWSKSMNLTGAYLADFWYLLLTFIFLLSVLYRWYKPAVRSNGLQKLPYQLGIFAMTALLVVLGIRGGVQLRPLMPITATRYVNDQRLAPLLSNSGLSILFSIGQGQLKEPDFVDEARLAHYFPRFRQYASNGGGPTENVVFIVLESFSQEYVGLFNDGPSYTPFLDSLLQAGYYSRNGLANGMRSTHGIVAISSSIPSLMEDPLMFSTYQGNRAEGIASILAQKGYGSAFFHGANPGSMALEKFAHLTGYDHFYDRDDYEKAHGPADYDGHWGIWDDPFFQYTAHQLNTFEEPFVSLLFSLTSHHPYKVPEAYARQYPEVPPIWRSIQYTDTALANFFRTARQMPWFERTLFVITADHLGKIVGGSPYLNSLGFFRIPILFYHPSKQLSGDTNRVISQIDLMPSVLDYLDYSEAFPAFGQSCFDTLAPAYGYMFHNGLYQIVDSAYLYQTDFRDAQYLFHHPTDPGLVHDRKLEQAEVAGAMDERLRAAVQRHHRGMVRNEWGSGER